MNDCASQFSYAAVIPANAGIHSARKLLDPGFRRGGSSFDRGFAVVIETIDIPRCTGCGICDIVCPADVIHMTATPQDTGIPGLTGIRVLPVIKFREHCITCFNCEIFCPEKIIDVHPVVKSHPRAW